MDSTKILISNTWVQEQCEGIQGLLVKWQKVLESRESTIDATKEHDLRAERDQLQLDNVRLRQEQKHLHDKCSKLQSDCDSLQGICNEWKECVESLKQQNRSLQESNTSLLQRESVMTTNQHVHDRNTAGCIKCEENVSARSRAEGVNDRLEKELQLARVELDHWRGKLSQSEIDNANALANARGELDALVAERMKPVADAFTQRIQEAERMCLQAVDARDNAIRTQKKAEDENEQLKQHLYSYHLTTMVAHEKGRMGEEQLFKFLKTNLGSCFHVKDVHKQAHCGDIQVTYHIPKSLTIGLPREKHNVVILIDNKERASPLSSAERDKFVVDMKTQGPDVGILRCLAHITGQNEFVEEHANGKIIMIEKDEGYRFVLPAILHGITTHLVRVLMDQQPKAHEKFPREILPLLNFSLVCKDTLMSVSGELYRCSESICSKAISLHSKSQSVLTETRMHLPPDVLHSVELGNHMGEDIVKSFHANVKRRHQKASQPSFSLPSPQYETMPHLEHGIRSPPIQGPASIVAAKKASLLQLVLPAHSPERKPKRQRKDQNPGNQPFPLPISCQSSIDGHTVFPTPAAHPAIDLTH
jgi:hypothetical protein